MEDAERPTTYVKRSGKILPNRKHLNQVSRDGEVLRRKQTGSLFSVEQVKRGCGDLVFLPPQLCFWQRGEGKVPDPTKCRAEI